MAHYARQLLSQPVPPPAPPSVAPTRSRVKFSIRVVDPKGDRGAVLQTLETPQVHELTKTPRAASFESDVMTQAEQLDREYEQRRNAFVERTLLQ